MKRTICFILLLALSLSCFACAKPANEGEVNANLAGADGVAAKGNNPQSQNPTAEPTIKPTEEPTPEPTPEPTLDLTFNLMPWEEFPDEYTKAVVELPCNFSERTDLNAHIFDIEPFEISFALPVGWSIKDEPDENGLMFVFDRWMTLWSKQFIFDETGRCIGAFGYNCHEKDSEKLGVVYPYIGNGAHYFFNFREKYTTVTELENTVTEISDVVCDKLFVEPYPYTAVYSEQDRINYGITSRNPNALVHVAFELCSDYVTEEQYMTIAESLRFE